MTPEALPQADASSLVDRVLLEAQVQEMYRRVAREETAELHFAVGRPLALRLGYPAELLDAIPAEALASFAGVGYHLDLAALAPGEHVLDLGSGSGTDVFCAAVQVGPEGRVMGVDFTHAQLAKAAALRDRDGFANVKFAEGVSVRTQEPGGLGWRPVGSDVGYPSRAEREGRARRNLPDAVLAVKLIGQSLFASG